MPMANTSLRISYFVFLETVEILGTKYTFTWFIRFARKTNKTRKHLYVAVLHQEAFKKNVGFFVSRM